MRRIRPEGPGASDRLLYEHELEFDLPDSEHAATPEAYLLASELEAAIFESMTEQQASVVWMAAIGMSADEIAAGLCLTPSAVRKRLHDGRRNARAVLEAE